MKKLLALCLACIMCLGLAACGNTDVNKPETQQEKNEKQSFYEDYFSEKEYEAAGKSLQIQTSEIVFNQIIDTNNFGIISGKVEDGEFQIIHLEDGDFAYANSDVEGETWYKVSDYTFDVNMFDPEEIISPFFTDVLEVQYVKHNNDVDHVAIVATNPFVEEGEQTLRHKAECTYEGQTYTIYIEERIVDNETEHIYVSDWGNCDVQGGIVSKSEQSIFTIGETIKYNIIETTDVSSKNLIGIEVYIHSKTKKITKIETSGLDEEIIIEFSHTEKYKPEFTIPNNTKVLSSEEAKKLYDTLFLLF